MSESKVTTDYSGVIKVSAPGKVILHGEHSVVYARRAVAVSIDLRTTLTLTPGGTEVAFDFKDTKIRESWRLEDIHDLWSLLWGTREAAGPSSLSEAQATELKNFLGISEDSRNPLKLALLAFFHLYLSILPRPVPATFSVTSQPPIGAGLGSSAAFAVCLSAALLRLARNSDLSHSASPTAGVAAPSSENHDLADTAASGSPVSDASHSPDPASAAAAPSLVHDVSRDEVCAWAFTSEQIVHGTPSGIDNSICTFGGAVNFKSGSCCPLGIPPLRVLLVNTKVPRSTKSLVSGVRERRHKLPRVVEPILDALDALAERSLEVLSDLSSAGSPQEEDTAYNTLHELVDMNHALLCALGVSHPSLDRLVGVARSHGLHAKLTGAGGGGFGVVVLGRDTCQKTVEGCRRELEEAGYQVWDTTLGAPGLTFH